MSGSIIPLAAPRDAQLDVWVVACVLLAEPLLQRDDPELPPAVGYYRNFGIRLNGPQPKQFLEKIIPDGLVDWDDTEVKEVDPTTLDEEIRSRISPPDQSGVWYKSGRMYFPADDAA